MRAALRPRNQKDNYEVEMVVSNHQIRSSGFDTNGFGISTWNEVQAQSDQDGGSIEYLKK